MASRTHLVPSMGVYWLDRTILCDTASTTGTARRRNTRDPFQPLRRLHKEKAPPLGRGRWTICYLRSISTSAPGRRSFSIVIPGSRLRSRSSMMVLSRESRPTVALGSRTQSVLQDGPTQDLSQTSSAPAGVQIIAEPARAAARVNALGCPHSGGSQLVFPPGQQRRRARSVRDWTDGIYPE